MAKRLTKLERVRQTEEYAAARTERRIRLREERLARSRKWLAEFEKREGGLPITLRLPVTTAMALFEAARDRRTTADVFAVALLRNAASSNLFNAILDEPIKRSSAGG